MNINDLHHIGTSLLQKIASVRNTSIIKAEEGRGAGGDKTHGIDRIAEEVILTELEALQEPLTLVSEEAGIIHLRGGGGITVVVDPIDGSRNAVAGIPLFCTSIAVADGETIGSVYLGYVINLVNGDRFWAERGRHSFFQGVRMQSQQSGDVSLVAYEAPVPSQDLPMISSLLSEATRVRCLGAMALDLCYLAVGAISIFTTPSPSRSFDFAAGCLMATEAGGVVTDVQGNSIQSVSLGLHKSTTLLAAGNRELHDKALALLNR